MSQYINFFLRVGDNFAPVGSFGASSRVYRIARAAPYEQIQPVAAAQLRHFITKTDQDINKTKEYIAAAQQKKSEIYAANNSLDSKVEYINECINPYIADARVELEELEWVAGYFMSLEAALEDVEYDEEHGINQNEYLYFGIECAHPTIEDIVKPQE